MAIIVANVALTGWEKIAATVIGAIGVILNEDKLRKSDASE